MTDAEWTELKKYYKFGLAERRPLRDYELEEQAGRIRSYRGTADFHKLVARVDMLRAALLKYGEHAQWCGYPRGCDCGYTEVLSKIQE